MKNTHILPTNKASRLYLHSDNELQIRTNIIRTSEDYLGSNQHIYITSDEEIKEGDWLYHRASNKLFKYDGQGLCVEVEKIILTTDPDLIGVQPIDDEFLEWFVKNPSCEEVEVKDVFKSSPIGFGNAFDYYKIIIPKEEPKQETPESIIQDIATHLSKTVPETLQHIEEFSKELDKLKSKQETLEEAAEKEAEGRYPVLTHSNPKNSPYVGTKQTFKHGVRFGAKWQQEKMYSEEEVLKLWNWLNDGFIIRKSLPTREELIGWFEQFKNK